MTTIKRAHIHDWWVSAHGGSGDERGGVRVVSICSVLVSAHCTGACAAVASHKRVNYEKTAARDILRFLSRYDDHAFRKLGSESSQNLA